MAETLKTTEPLSLVEILQTAGSPLYLLEAAEVELGLMPGTLPSGTNLPGMNRLKKEFWEGVKRGEIIFTNDRRMALPQHLLASEAS